MKIGIITLPLHTNYGGILQAYALQTVLERMGHEVKVVDVNVSQPFQLPVWKKPLVYCKRILKRYVFRKVQAPILYEKFYVEKQKEIAQNTRRFIDRHIHLIHAECYKNLSQNDFDAYVVGSDQVWRPKYFPAINGMSIADAYLSFASSWNVKRIAYAVSFGTDLIEYTHSQAKTCGHLLAKFDMVSVREADAVGMVRKMFGIDAVHVLDPTMLLKKEDYCRLINQMEYPGYDKCNEKSKPFILNYVLDENREISEAINLLAKEKELDVVRSKNKELTFDDYTIECFEENIQPPVEAWLRDFRDCQYVVTDSFHACVFSILFRKQFVVFGNKKRGMSRFHSLLGLFGLEGRMVETDGDILSVIETSIDYDKVYKQLEQLREESLNVLQRINDILA